MPYSPSGGAVSKQLPFGMSNLPLDAKLKYDDTVNFTKRAFISTAEILAYFPEDSPFREGNFEILLNTGGSLSNGIITGGIESIWWFSRGTLIQKYYTTLEVDNLISGITPEIPSLQQVTTGTGNNVTANAVQFSGIGNLNLSVDSLIGFGGTGETGFINIVNGQATGAIGFKPLESVFKFQTSAAPADQYSFSLRPEDENTSGALINRRLEFNAGINPTEGVVLSQLDNYQLRTEKGIANGYASLGSNGKIPNNQLPALAISETFVVSSQAAMLALSGAEEGDVAVRTDISESFILTATPASTLSNWQELLTPTAPVQSVNGQVGNVNLTTTNITEGTNLYYLDARVSANSDVVLNSALRHAAVSLGATNGLSLSGQQLSLGLSSGSSTGSLSSTDWTTFNNKQPAGNYALVSQIPTPSNYITNGTSLQTSSNFYISGNGRMNTLTLSTSPVDKVGTTAEILVRNSTTGAIEKLNGDNSTYVRGNGILAGFESAVRSTFLNGMVAGTNTPIVTSNSVIVAFANLQAQITSRVDITGSYADPVWLTSLAYSKLTGAPSIPIDANLLHTTGNETKNGRLTLTSPAGTSSTSPTSSVTPLAVTGGKGGNHTGTSGTASAGNATEIKFLAGGGGDVPNMTSGTAISGIGGDVNLNAGPGGQIFGTPDTQVPGRGGNAILAGGDTFGGIAGNGQLKAGNNLKAGFRGGSLFFVAGYGDNNFVSNPLYDGAIYLGVSSVGIIRGNTILGSSSDDGLNRLQVTGDSKFLGKVSVVGNIGQNSLMLSKPSNNLPSIEFVGATASSIIEAGDDLNLYTNGVLRSTINKVGLTTFYQNISSSTVPSSGDHLTNKTYVDTKSPLASPDFTGIPTAPTAVAGTNTTQIATTGFVTSNFVDKTTNQTSGLTGDKIWDGYHEFRQSVVVGPLVNSTTYSNISIGTQTAILTFPAGNGVLGYRPIVNTSLNTIQTSASLNTAYPTAAIGQHVTAPNVGTGMKYEKINTTGGGTWMSWAASTI